MSLPARSGDLAPRPSGSPYLTGKWSVRPPRGLRPGGRFLSRGRVALGALHWLGLVNLSPRSMVHGGGPGAAIALARGDGTIAKYVPDVDTLDRATVEACPLTVVDAGAVDLRDEGAADEITQVNDVDANLQHVLDVVPDNATVLVVSLANARRKAQLEAVALKGPGIPVGGLTTDSTRHDNLVLLTDITPTIYRLVGL